MTHVLRVERTFADGRTDSWSLEQDGDAAPSHAALIQRWRNAGFVFEYDRHSITRTCTDVERGGPYVDVLTHRDQEATLCDPQLG